jgi:hypothetical protein
VGRQGHDRQHAEPRQGEVEEQEFGHVGQLEQHPLAGLQAEVGEADRHALDPHRQLAVGQAPLGEAELGGLRTDQGLPVAKGAGGAQGHLADRPRLPVTRRLVAGREVVGPGDTAREHDHSPP